MVEIIERAATKVEKEDAEGTRDAEAEGVGVTEVRRKTTKILIIPICTK